MKKDKINLKSIEFIPNYLIEKELWS
jgi:hypothetical protein